MKNGSILFRKTVSLLLCLTMLFVGPTVFAFEVAAQTVSGIISSENDSGGRELAELLDDIENFSRFSDAEKSKIYEYLSDGATSAALGSGVSSVESDATAIFVAEEASKNERGIETALFEIIRRCEKWSQTTDNDRAYILEYLNILSDSRNAVGKLFEKLETNGNDLYNSVFKIKVLSLGIFTESEVNSIFALYPARGERDREVNAFYGFSLHFEIADTVNKGRYIDSDELSAMHSTYTEKQRNLRKLYADYISEDAFAVAKKLFLSGMSANEVKQFFIALIASEGSVSSSVLSTSSISKNTAAVYSITGSTEEVRVHFGKGKVSAYCNDIAVSNNTAITMNVLGQTTVATLEEYNNAAALFTSGNVSTASLAVMSSGGSETNIAAPTYIDINGEESISVNDSMPSHRFDIISLGGRGSVDFSLSAIYDTSVKPSYYTDVRFMYYVTGEVTTYLCNNITGYWETLDVEEVYESYYWFEDAYESYLEYENSNGTAEEVGDEIYLVRETSVYIVEYPCGVAVGDNVSNIVSSSDGWFYDIPYLEIDEDNVVHYVCMPDKGSYYLWKNTGGYYLNHNSIIYSFAAYTSYTNVYGKTSAFKCVLADGTELYFNSNGRLIAEVDISGYTVSYNYDTDKRLTGMKDSYGRTLNVTRAANGNESFSYVAKAGQTAVSLGSIEYSEWAYPDYTGTVTSKITDRNGISRIFTYDLLEYVSYGEGGFMEGSSRGFPAIRKITYSTGAITEYTYDTYSFFVGYYYEQPAELYGYIPHLTKYRTYTNAGGNVTDFLVLEVEAYIPDVEQYTRVEYFDLVYPDGTAFRYAYDPYYYVLTTQKLTNDATPKVWYEKIETRTADGYPTSISEKNYSHGTLDVSESFTYDKYFNVASHTDAHGIKTTYTYYTTDVASNIKRYDLPKSESYSFAVGDTTHTVLTEYTITSNGKNVAGKTVKLDGTLVARTDYYYDASENLVRTVEYFTLGTSAATRETLYDYTDHDTARGWNGLYLTSVTVTGVKDADGAALANSVLRYEYDNAGNVVAEYDANGNKTTYEYDVSGNITAEKKYTLSNGAYTLYSTETYSRNYAANDLTYTDVKNNVYLYDYDLAGRLVTVTRTLQSGTQAVIESYTYDDCARVSTVTNISGLDTSSKTVYYYDNRGELYKTAVFDESANISTATPLRQEYTEFVTETVDGAAVCVGYRTVVNGLSTAETAYEEYRTDKYGQVTEKRVYYGTTPSASGQITRYTYDAFGRKTTESYVAENGTELVTARYTYDVFGNVTAVTDVFGNTAYASYDAAGRKTSETDAKNAVTTYAYDVLDRVIETRKPLNAAQNIYSVSRTYYDGAGNVIKTKQSNNADNSSTVTYTQKEYVYDSLNRVTDVNTGGSWVHYVYDVTNNVTHIYSGMTAKWTAAMSANAYSLVRYEYDTLGNVTKLTDELGNAESYTYDALGMLKKTVQRNGNYITYTYDVLGDLLTEAAYNSANASLGSIVNTYDAMGRTLTRTYGGNTDRYTYTKGQTATAITNGTVEKTYGRNGNALTYTLKDGAGNLADKVSYTYDNALRLAGVTDYSAHNGTTALYTVSYTYDANGNRTSEISTAGTEVYYLYNEAGLVTSVMNYAGSSGGSPVATEAYTYSYYTDGNQRTKQDSVTGKKTTYVYDAAGRLTSETESVNGTVTQTYAYTYDASGNRLTLTASGNEAYSVAYTYDKANRLLTETKTVSGVATVKTYTYDLNGNLLTVSEGGSVTESYTYDAFGKMLSYTKSGTTTAYTYRPDGMLYTKQTGSDASTKKTYISSDGKIVFEQTGTDNVGAVVYSYGLTMISAKSRTSLTAQQGIRYYYLYNAHGDVVRIISGTNVTVKTYDYDAFGNDRSAVAGDTNPFRYCGEYFDTATETYFLRARWYDPATGRFTQQDAWAYYDVNDPLSLNLYVYCFGNPVRYWDPEGNASTDNFDNANDMLSQGFDDPKSGGGGNNTNTQPTGQGQTSQSHSKSGGNSRLNVEFYGKKNFSYMEKRKWDLKKLAEAIKNGPKGSSINRANGNLCEVYCYPGSYYYVVVENNSFRMVQLSEFGNDNWIIHDDIRWYK